MTLDYMRIEKHLKAHGYINDDCFKKPKKKKWKVKVVVLVASVLIILFFRYA